MKHNKGFSLVELALALLVVSVGLVALIGLFVSGMNASQIADRETRAAFFAQTVFNTVTAEMQREWPSSLNGQRYELGTQWLVEGGQPGSGFVEFSANSNAFKIAYAEPQSTITNWFNYVLSPQIPLTGVDALRGIRLEVWPGQFVNTETNGVVFYTEIYRMN